MCNPAGHSTVCDCPVGVSAEDSGYLGGTLIKIGCVLVEEGVWKESNNSAD